MKRHLHKVKKHLLLPEIAAVLLFCIAAALAITFKAPRPEASFGQNYYTTLTDYAGKSVTFESFRGRPLVVFFWATWCPYCAQEFKDLAPLAGQGGVVVLAVNRGESAADAKGFTDGLGLPAGIVPLLDQNDSLFKKLNGYAMPVTVFINPVGEVVAHLRGPATAAQLASSTAEIEP